MEFLLAKIIKRLFFRGIYKVSRFIMNIVVLAIIIGIIILGLSGCTFWEQNSNLPEYVEIGNGSDTNFEDLTDNNTEFFSDEISDWDVETLNTNISETTESLFESNYKDIKDVISSNYIPFDGTSAYFVVNNNIPLFLNNNNYFSIGGDSTTVNCETLHLSEIDSLGRCGQCYALVSRESLPTDARQDIGMIRPSGWHTIKFNDIIEGNYLYNRSHLLAFCLTGINAEEKALITGTRFLNVDGMLPFEMEVLKYVSKSDNQVFIRVTPIFNDTELVARGVLMEAYSLEDNGKGLCFCVYCYNAQPGVEIDYNSGEASRVESYDFSAISEGFSSVVY